MDSGLNAVVSVGPLRVLIAHRYLWPENLSLYPAMLKDVAEWHGQRDDQTTILTAAAADPSNKLRRRIWSDANGITLVETQLGIDRGRHPLVRIVNSLRYGVRLLTTLVSNRFDLVLVTSYPPVLPATIARLCAKFKGFEFVYYIQDNFPESFATSHRSVWKFVGRLLRWLDARNMRSAVGTITLSEDMKQTIVKSGVDERRVFVIPNFSIDAPEEFQARSRKGPPTLVYAGNHGSAQNLEFFLRAAHRAALHCEFRIQMIGAGSQHEHIRRFVESERIENVEFIGCLPREEAQRLIGQADAAVVPARPGLYDVAFPSKLMSYLVAGLPTLVFAGEQSGVARFVDTHAFGCAASPTDIDNAATAIMEFVNRVSTGVYDRAGIARQAAQLFSKQQYFFAYGDMLAETVAKE